MRQLRGNYGKFITEDLIYPMFEKAVGQEIEWTNHIIGNDILGITKERTVTSYNQSSVISGWDQL